MHYIASNDTYEGKIKRTRFITRPKLIDLNDQEPLYISLKIYALWLDFLDVEKESNHGT